WLRDLEALLHRTRARAPRKTRPVVEALEDRTVPATFIVSNANDDGTGSLRQAIRDANGAAGADTITFQASSFPTGSQINLTTGDYHINDSVAIQGPGVMNLTLNGANNSTNFGIITIDSAEASDPEGGGGSGVPSKNAPGTLITVSISGMTIANGASGVGGGGVRVNGENVTLQSIAFENNVTNTVGADGGAVLI